MDPIKAIEKSEVSVNQMNLNSKGRILASLPTPNEVKKVEPFKARASNPQVTEKVVLSIQQWLTHIEPSERNKVLELVKKHPLESTRVISELLKGLPYNETALRVHLLSMAVDLLESVNQELSQMKRKSLTGDEIFKISKQMIDFEMDAPEYLEFPRAEKYTEAIKDSLQHSGDLVFQDGKYFKKSIEPKIMSIQLGARLPMPFKNDVLSAILADTSKNSAQELISSISKDLLK